MNEIEIRVVYDAAHEIDTRTFDKDGTPMLTFDTRPDYGPGCVLSYLEETATG
jgi:hypothetical protein